MLQTMGHRFRPFLIGLVVLILTTGVAFAGKPETPAGGRAVGPEASGRTVPVANEADKDKDKDKDETPGEEEAADEANEADGEGGENCATDPTELTDEQLAELTHGQIVCWAAHQETPDGYDNHGQWVSEWARKNHGQEKKAANSLRVKGSNKQ